MRGSKIVIFMEVLCLEIFQCFPDQFAVAKPQIRNSTMTSFRAQETSHGARLSAAAGVARGETPPNWIPVKEQPAYTPRKIKIICVGAGFAGLTLAHKIKHGLGGADFIDYTIYDKNAEVGGVWVENRYPGVAW
jgi:hypothetical protein